MSGALPTCNTHFLLALTLLAVSIRMQGYGLSVSESEQQKYSILKDMLSTSVNAHGFLSTSEQVAHTLLHNQQTVESPPHMKPNLSRKLMKFSHALITSSGAHRSMQNRGRIFQHDGMARRLSDKLMISQIGNGGAATSTQQHKAMTAPGLVFDNVSAKYSNNDKDTANDNNRGIPSRRTSGDVTNPVVHGSNANNNDTRVMTIGNDSNHPVLHGNIESNEDNEDYNDRKSSAPLDDFSASFHVDYHKPGTHPPKNN